MTTSAMKFDVSRVFYVVNVNYSQYYDQFGGVPELYQVIESVEQEYANVVPDMDLVYVEYQDSDGFDNYTFQLEFVKTA